MHVDIKRPERSYEQLACWTNYSVHPPRSKASLRTSPLLTMWHAETASILHGTGLPPADPAGGKRVPRRALGLHH